MQINISEVDFADHVWRLKKKGILHKIRWKSAKFQQESASLV